MANSAFSGTTFLDNRHPDYLRHEIDWRFWQASYTGGSAYQDGGHLFRFTRETQANYRERLKRASRLNFTRQVLDLMIQYLHKAPPIRQTAQASSALQTFWKDADRQGNPLTVLMKQASQMAALFGHYYLMVDKPSAVAETQQEQAERKLQPYAYGISPLDVLDWVTDSTSGEFLQVLIREYTRGPINLMEAGAHFQLQERFRLWLKTDDGVLWILFRKNDDGQPEELERGIATIPRIPLVRLSRTGGSLAEDIAPLDRKIFNYESLLDQILYDQTFSTLRLPWSGRLEDFYEQWELTLGTKSILPYNPTAGAAPDFIAPDANQGELMLKAIDQSINRIYQAKNLLDTVNGIQSASTPASGIARGYDFEKLNAGLAAFADDLEKAERELATFVHLWEGITEAISLDWIDYPDTFDVKTLLQDLDESRQLAQSVTSPTFHQYLQNRLVQKAAPKLPDALAQTIRKEIDNTPTSPNIQSHGSE